MAPFVKDFDQYTGKMSVHNFLSACQHEKSWSCMFSSYVCCGGYHAAYYPDLLQTDQPASCLCCKVLLALLHEDAAYKFGSHGSRSAELYTNYAWVLSKHTQPPACSALGIHTKTQSQSSEARRGSTCPLDSLHRHSKSLLQRSHDWQLIFWGEADTSAASISCACWLPEV